MYTYLFHGPSGAGKDTQVEMILKEYDVERIATGEMFRKLYEDKDPKGIEAHKYWGEGKFVPDQLTYELLDMWLKRFDTNKDWIFVSVVRSPNQIEMFDKIIEKNNRILNRFVHFTLGIQDILKRKTLRRICPKCQATYHPDFKIEKISGICDYDNAQLVQRSDDTKEKTLSLISEYQKGINGILEEYQTRGILLDIDASPSIEEIYNILKTELRFSNER